MSPKAQVIKHVQAGPGRPYPLGAEWDGEGVNFAAFSAHAEKIELCLFGPEAVQEKARIAFPERTGDIWHAYIPGLAPGAVYGLRAHGPYDPDNGHRFNPHKLLLDPYAKQIRGQVTWNDALYGYTPGSRREDLSFDRRDSARYMPKCVVVAPESSWDSADRPQTPWHETVLYEAHPKGLTMTRLDVPEQARGRFRGLASEPMLEHLVKLGITAIELLPAHAFVDEGVLKKQGLCNYWGYNSIGFFAPEPRYLGDGGVADFRQMVQRFHAAGIEVILDVVYNHTGEADELGPTLCFRGLDNASYYRLNPDHKRYYVNDSGCGNTLNVSHPHVLRMVLDSLRYWVDVMGVDGFRFDLATTLGREDHGFDRDGSFFCAVSQDPVLSRVKLIAESWDLGPGGYRLGEFPKCFGEWNDTFRDSVRQFWRGDRHKAPDLAARLLGSAERFDDAGRRPWSSINYVTSHDGFTLADVVSYARKSNHANGEDNRDGHDSNFSSNCGVEGPTEDPKVLARRAQRRRNLLATVFLAQGTPMLLAGDEAGNGQGGNNNAYCQDNDVGWVDWSVIDPDFLDFTRRLVALRRAHPALRQARFLHGLSRPADDAPETEWHGVDGKPPQWNDPQLRQIGLLLRGSAQAPVYAAVDEALFLAFNGGPSARFALPEPPAGAAWIRVLDTAKANGDTEAIREVKSTALVGAESIAVFALGDAVP